MFISIKLANGETVVINRELIESVERDDADPTTFQLHLGTRHYLIDAKQYLKLCTDHFGMADQDAAAVVGIALDAGATDAAPALVESA